MPTAPMRTPRRLLVAALSFALLADSHWSAAADTSLPKVAGAPPRIGLALSGGGARGIAHVGVLKVLDEMRIPIHCVTGTSMGAIVGGTFAVGTSPEDIEKIVLDANWDELFRDNPPRGGNLDPAQDRRLQDAVRARVRRQGRRPGAAEGRDRRASRSRRSSASLAAPASGITDFDKLPIPFRAMATDIETGEAVVLDHGSVAQAMRASMSVPGAMAPVEIDGRLLVDGGIANNLPIDEARKLCADVVIAVNISTPPLKRERDHLGACGRRCS